MPLPAVSNIEQINAIIEQLQRVGIMSEGDTNHLPNAVVPCLYSIDSPVQAESIRRVLSHNAGVLLGQGGKRREATAIAASHALARETIADDIMPTEYEATVEQEEVSEAGEKRIEEGIKVADKPGDVPDNRSRRRKTA